VDPALVARALNLGRLGVGAALVLAPGRVAPLWVGRDGTRAGTRTIAVALGARDLALGIGTLQALAAGGDAATPWLRTALLADGADCLATLRARRELPSLGALLVAAMAAGATVAGAWAQGALPADQPRP